MCISNFNLFTNARSGVWRLLQALHSIVHGFIAVLVGEFINSRVEKRFKYLQIIGRHLQLRNVLFEFLAFNVDAREETKRNVPDSLLYASSIIIISSNYAT